MKKREKRLFFGVFGDFLPPSDFPRGFRGNFLFSPILAYTAGQPPVFEKFFFDCNLTGKSVVFDRKYVVSLYPLRRGIEKC